MRFLIAPNAFKGTIRAEEAAKLIADKIGALGEAECLTQPVADGGDGTCHLLIESLGLEKIQVWTLNAIGQPILGYFGWDSKERKAYLDISTASGIGSLQKHQKNPFISSSFGTGMVIRKAVELGAKDIVLGLGGSATIDMGIGVLRALGVLFLDQNGREIPVFSPGYLSQIKHIQHSPVTPRIRFTLLCDVRNPFLGPEGAVQVFGPQKGLELGQLGAFENACEQVLGFLIKKSKAGWTDQAGYGAAGGIALGLGFYFESEIRFGASYFFELVQMKDKVVWSDWIITGEGQYDSQSDQGKASFELLKLARAHRKKIALVTSGEGGRDAGFDLVLELPPLDFSNPKYKEMAVRNLRDLVDKAVSDGSLH
jgi:glycerate kinase